MCHVIQERLTSSALLGRSRWYPYRSHCGWSLCAAVFSDGRTRDHELDQGPFVEVHDSSWDCATEDE